MNQANHTRRALVDLPVNTIGTPSPISNAEKSPINNKRPIDAVTEPEYPRPPSRIKVPHTQPQSIRKDGMRLPDAESAVPSGVAPSPRSVIPVATVEQREPVEEIGDGDSQNSCISTIDFDPDDTMASQQTAATELTQPLQSRPSQHAETLRLRLRLAHFKVKTNQIHIPLSQLRISTNESRDLSPTQEPSLPKLLPAPILKPTAYSALNVMQAQASSSPPSSPEISLGKEVHNDIFRTPALPRQSVTASQTSSPPDSQERVSGHQYNESDSLTSSAVRGKAAIGLLGLRQER